ncbi:MAG: acetyl-CoA carboxylase biotin carboxylase subunit [Deltaproteobacteria bacterium]|nr:acetyl-CoA carboxylase biotin carboxylase subunit [Deltaproteobacteria bacterium]
MTTRKIKRVLVANRGEIAVRVMRTCHERGIETVAVYSEPDRVALHTRTAQRAECIGPAPSRDSYLRMDRILDAAKKHGADAIHPGYGFLSEKAEFARACADAGVTFIGPPAAAIDAMGEKTRARATMKAAGVPVVPGTDGPVDDATAIAFARQVGLPVMVKAAAGGGGKGMRKVTREEDLATAVAGARREAMSAFGDDSLYVEKFLEKPRHVEIQVFADTHSNVHHLFERECSVQRRNQKIIEEAPSSVVTPPMRRAMGEIAVKGARAVGYLNAGTVEFLVDANRKFYFLEMNTRLQVEHPVTEWVTGFDLVGAQLDVAEGLPLPWGDQPESPRGWAMEARIYAEDPAQGFLPQPGRITSLRVPDGPGVRDDSGVYAGYEVTPFYDPMIAKLSCWASSRQAVMDKLIRALNEYSVKGINTNIGYLVRILQHPAFRAGDYDTGFIERHMQGPAALPPENLRTAALLAAAFFRESEEERLRHQVVAARPSEGGGGQTAWQRAFGPGGR